MPKHDPEAKAKAIAAGHETRDLNVRGVVYFAVGLVVCAIIIHGAVAGLEYLFGERFPFTAPASRIAKPRTFPQPPQLQTDPSEDMARFRAQEDAALSRYQWVNRPAGVVQIPIERAMELIAQRGLPVTSGTGKTPLQMRQEKAVPTQTPP